MKQRKRNRLKDYDYSQAGCYFVTICSQNKVDYFGEIINGEMKLNPIGKIISDKWVWLEKQYPYIILDEHVVMPNHFHGILAIVEPLCSKEKDPVSKIKSLSSLIGAFKTTSSKLIHLNLDSNFSWQKSFYDRIIRNETEFGNVQSYIRYNPLKWEWDIENKISSAKISTGYYNNIFKKTEAIQ